LPPRQQNVRLSQCSSGGEKERSSQAPDQGSTVDDREQVCLKSIMKGSCFADVAAIQERVTVALQSILKDSFADSFQKLYEHCQQCIVKDGDYFEGQ
jgi:hypothetical protein